MVGVMLLRPSRMLLSNIPAVESTLQSLENKARAIFGMDPLSVADKIENHVGDALTWIVGFLNAMSIAIVYGVWSPILLLFAAAVGPFSLLASSLVMRFTRDLGSDQILHYKMAFELKAQVPTKHFGLWTITCLVISTLCALYDYGFGCGSWIVFGVCILGYIVTRKICANRESLLACPKDEIQFVRIPQRVTFKKDHVGEVAAITFDI